MLYCVLAGTRKKIVKGMWVTNKAQIVNESTNAAVIYCSALVSIPRTQVLCSSTVLALVSTTHAHTHVP